MTFLYPYVLIALAAPLLLTLLLILQRRWTGHGWRALVSPSHPELVHRRPHWQEILPPALALAALTGIILAAARPINGYTQSEGAATGRNLLIALDISRSMETQDVSPSRLEEARAAAYELIEALPSDKIGLIVFSGEADVVVPLTYDHTALRDALEQVNRSWAGYGGTNFGLLLRCAMQNFARSAPDGANALVILSDGEDTVDSSLQIAEEARKSNLLVITVGIGTPVGGAIPDTKGENGLWEDANGRHVISKLDTNALRRFSEATGGSFFTMSSGADLTAFAREAANKLERHEETFETGRVPLDLFAWFAIPSLLALIASIILRSEWRAARHTALIALIAALGMAPSAHAGSLADSALYGLGIEAMKGGNEESARQLLSEALLSDDTTLQAAVHLALGNMQVRSTFDKLRSLYEPSSEENRSPHSPGIDDLQSIVDELKKNINSYHDALNADSTLSAAQTNTDKVQELIRKLEEEIERLKQQQNQQNQDNKQDQQDQQNQDDKQDQQNQDNKQDQQDQQNQDNKQDQQDQQNQDNKQDQQDQQNQDDKQDQQDQQNQDNKQDQQDQQNQDNKQDQQDQQNQDDKQDQQDHQNQDDKQDQQDQQNQDDKQDQQASAEDRQANEAQAHELSDEEKAKQRAAGILRMHLDEEKGSPIPHDNRAVRPPIKDY